MTVNKRGEIEGMKIMCSRKHQEGSTWLWIYVIVIAHYTFPTCEHPNLNIITHTKIYFCERFLLLINIFCGGLVVSVFIGKIKRCEKDEKK
jgi:hypothetical protein